MALLVALGCSNEPSTDPGVAENAGAKNETTTWALPPTNPYLMQNSVYPVVHFNASSTDVTPIESWTGSFELSPSQVTWIPSVASVGAGHYAYPDGEDALFVAGTSRASKIRITGGDFTMIDELHIPGYEQESISTPEIRRLVKEMEAAEGDEEAYLRAVRQYINKIGQSSERIGDAVYTVLDKDGNYYAGWGTTLYMIADERPGEVHSPLQIVTSFDIRSSFPAEIAATISRLIGVTMTYDGYLVIAMPGIIGVLDRDLTNMEYILMEGEAVDNGISVDSDGGIYVVTSQYMRKLVWDGTRISEEAADGAWKSPYDYVPNTRAFSRGAGNTPTLMGFGPDEDKLVIVADAGDPVKIVAFWREEIPDDFEQKPGTQSRRIADQLVIAH